MELSASHLFIWNSQFPGVLKSSMVKDFHDIKLRIDFYKIQTSDRQLIEMVKKNCEVDTTNVDTLKLVSTDNIYSKSLSYTDSEEFISRLRFINARNIQEDIKNGQRWIIEFKFVADLNFFKVIMDSQQTLRLYNQVNSFYSNYLVLAAMAKHQVLVEDDKSNKNEKKVTEYIPTQIQPVEVEIPVSPHQLISRERSCLDDIFELCLTSSIKSSLIHYTFNYFRYITDKHCSILTNDKSQVQYTLPMIFPGKFSVDEHYFQSLTVSNLSIASNNVTYAIKKILQNLYENHQKYKENSLYLMMMSYLLFVYMLRYLCDSNKESFRHNFKHFMCLPYTQTELLMRMMASGFPDFSKKIFFKISNIDLSDINEDYNLEKINKLSTDYKHLIPVSQKEFANKIFVEIKDETRKEPNDFKLSCKKVIDISKLIDSGQKQQRVTKSVLFDPDNTLIEIDDTNKEYNYLDYKLISNNGSKVITKTYQRILEYVKNPGSILLMTENEIPKEVKNLFEVISKKVLNSSRITKDNVSTLNYYNLLLEFLPNPKNFRHTTLLYIIYQIIIPYQFDIYGNSQFEDCFL